MSDLKISDMMSMQKELFELHKDTWSPMEADNGRIYTEEYKNKYE